MHARVFTFSDQIYRGLNTGSHVLKCASLLTELFRYTNQITRRSIQQVHFSTPEMDKISDYSISAFNFVFEKLKNLPYAEEALCLWNFVFTVFIYDTLTVLTS